MITPTSSSGRFVRGVVVIRDVRYTEVLFALRVRHKLSRLLR